MADDKKLGILLSVFLALIVGIPLISQLGNSVNEATTAQTVQNETVTFTGGNGTLANDEIVALTSIVNNTGYSYTNQIGVGVNVTSGGAITSNVSGADTTYYVAYTYTNDNYVADSQSRTLISLLVLFFALALLAVGIYTVYSMGLFDGLK